MPQTWNEFSSSATVHGLRFLNKDSSLKRRIIWSVLVLTATGFLVLQVYESVRRFCQFKVNTVIHLTNDGKTKYPSITICNANTLRKNKLNKPPFRNDTRVKGLMQLSKQVIFDTNLTTVGINNSTGYSFSGEDLQYLFSECGHTMKPMKDGGMLDYCRAPNHAQCGYNNFTTTLTYTGLCYTLNSDTQANKGIYASASGRFSSVRLKLAVQVDEYSLSIGNSESVGINVLVHDQLDPPFADTHGILIGPGVHASIAIKKTKFESLKHPYESKCREENLSGSIHYSRLACLRMCEENFVIEKCKCKMPVDTINSRNDVPLCNASQMFSCGIPAETTLFPAKKNKCDCPFACHSVEYTTTMSQAPYPTEPRGREQAVIDLKKMNKNISEENIQRRLKFYRDNIILLDIFYEKLDYLTIKQVPESKPVGLIASIGGLLGISLGASLLTVIEVLDYLLSCCTKVFYLFLKRKSRVNDETHAVREIGVKTTQIV